MQITPKHVALTLGAIGVGGAVALFLAGCTANENKSPEAVAAETMAKFDSGLPWTNSTQLDVRGESRRPDFALDGQLRGTYDAVALLSAADNWTFGKPENLNPQFDVQSNGKASMNEIVQVVRHYDGDGSRILEKEEAKQFNREMAPNFTPNPFYNPFPEDDYPEV